MGGGSNVWENFNPDMSDKVERLVKEIARLKDIIELAYIQGRNDEKQNNRPPYIKIVTGWEEFKKEQNL